MFHKFSCLYSDPDTGLWTTLDMALVFIVRCALMAPSFLRFLAQNPAGAIRQKCGQGQDRPDDVSH